MLQVPVKAGSITHLTDARFFAAYDVPYIGFNFDPLSPNYISPTQAMAIKGWLTGPQFVAEFDNQDEEDIRNIIAFFQPDIVQFTASMIRENSQLLQITELPLIIDLNDACIPADSNNILFYIVDKLNRSHAIPAEKCMINYRDEIPPANPQTPIHLTGTPEQLTGIKVYDAIGDWMEGVSG